MSELNSIPKATAFSPDQIKNAEVNAAARANAMPYVQVVTMEKFEELCRGAVSVVTILPLSVVLDASGFVVEPHDPLGIGNEGYAAFHGTHTLLGEFFGFWSMRGPGDGVRPRPVFIFHDGEPVFIS